MANKQQQQQQKWGKKTQLFNLFEIFDLETKKNRAMLHLQKQQLTW